MRAMNYTTDDIFNNPEMVENEHAQREKMLLDIITAPDFAAMEIPHDYGVYYIHKSNRAGVAWQLSRLAKDGIFNGHTDINNVDAFFDVYKGIMHDLIMPCRRKDVTIQYVTA